MILRALGVVTDQQRQFTCNRCHQVFIVVLVDMHGVNLLTGERYSGRIWQEPTKHACSAGFDHQSAIIGEMFK